MTSRDTESVPVVWINLERSEGRRRRMLRALASGGWTHQRVDAVDAADPSIPLRSRRDWTRRGSAFPGVRRLSESSPWRRTSRAELACLASWQRAIARAAKTMRDLSAETALLVEDDCGATLTCPDAWPATLQEIAMAAGPNWQAVQLAPINPRVRRELFTRWRESGQLVAPKSQFRSHGNGAVLLHRCAIPSLEAHLPEGPDRLEQPIRHPWAVRPVADKWLYSMLPRDAVFMANVPIFTQDAVDSELHSDHVERFQRGSRREVEAIWREAGWSELAKALAAWDSVD